MNYRKIIHIDLDAFYCAVEEKYDPSLRGLAFAVGGPPEERGVVASCSYAARKFGVRSAMPTARALKLCPHLKIISGKHSRYSEESRRVMEALKNITETLEQISIDEAFLDVTQNIGEAEVIARSLQDTIRAKFSLPCSLGVATNKLVAKIATDVGKAAAKTAGPPNAIHVVLPGSEMDFLAPLPAESLWGVGPKMSARLVELGIHTIGQIAEQSEADLVRWFGKHGHDLYLHSRGIDSRKVETTREAKSVSKETTFPKDVRDGDQLRKTLRSLAEGVSRRLKREKLAGSTVKIKLRWSDFTTLTRQASVDAPTDQLDVIYDAANRLLESAWQPGRPVRLIGVGVSNLGAPIRQLSLWNFESERQLSEKENRLKSAVQMLQDKYGSQAIHWGSQEAGE